MIDPVENSKVEQMLVKLVQKGATLTGRHSRRFIEVNGDVRCVLTEAQAKDWWENVRGGPKADQYYDLPLVWRVQMRAGMGPWKARRCGHRHIEDDRTWLCQLWFRHAGPHQSVSGHRRWPNTKPGDRRDGP